MSPERRPSTTASPQKSLLNRQLASISKILAQASKDTKSDLQKKRERPTSSPAQIRAPDIDGDPKSNRSLIRSSPVGLGQQHNISNGTGGMVVQTDFRTSATAGSPDGSSPPDQRGESIESSMRGSGQGDPAIQTEALGVENDPRRMMAELVSSTRSSRTASIEADNQEVDLHELRVKLSNLFPPACDAPPSFADSIDLNPRPEIHMRAPSLPKECVPYAVALQLEKAGCDWQEVVRFTKYLFNRSLNDYVAQQEKECVVDLADMKLDEINQPGLKEELACHVAEDVTRLSCRLVLTNIAADAQESDILECLDQSGFKFNIHECKFLDERHVNRTRTVHIDMNSRQEAKRASRIHGHIFGLRVHLQLVIDKD